MDSGGWCWEVMEGGGGWGQKVGGGGGAWWRKVSCSEVWRSLVRADGGWGDLVADGAKGGLQLLLQRVRVLGREHRRDALHLLEPVM